MMALAFQDMLKWFDLTQKILTLNANNAISNDKQTTKLSKLDNSFKEEHWARCFNHTIQLSAKTLLKPFHMALSHRAKDDDEIVEEEDGDLLELVVNKEDSDEEEEEEEENQDNVEDNIDELEELSNDEWVQILADTAAIHETVTKICNNEAENVCF